MGGAQLVKSGRVLCLHILPGDGGGARTLDVPAQPYETAWLEQSALFANEVVATVSILAAAWLVWTRPGAMTWGFFLYAIWFNSGQNFVFYAFLQDRPRLLLAQEAAGAVLEGVAYAGFLLFVLRAPSTAPIRLGAAGGLCCRWWRSCSSGCRRRATRTLSGSHRACPGRRSSLDLWSMRRRS